MLKKILLCALICLSINANANEIIVNNINELNLYLNDSSNNNSQVENFNQNIDKYSKHKKYAISAAVLLTGFALLKANIFPKHWVEHPIDRISHFLLGTSLGIGINEFELPTWMNFASAMAIGPLKELADQNYDPIDSAASVYGVSTGYNLSKIHKEYSQTNMLNSQQYVFTNICDSFTNKNQLDSTDAASIGLFSIYAGINQNPDEIAAISTALGAIYANNKLSQANDETKLTYIPLLTGSLNAVSMAKASTMLFEMSNPTAITLSLLYGASSAYLKNQNIKAKINYCKKLLDNKAEIY